jgi:hypothetical protein
MIDTAKIEAHSNARDCEHGQLRRSCNICEYEKEIAELKLLLSLAHTHVHDAGDFELGRKINEAI